MYMAQFTDFGKTVKKALIDKGQTQAWLIDEVREKTGLFFDYGYLYKIMTGGRTAAKVVDAINDILDLD